MLSWVVTFLIVALIAGILGFGGIAGVSIEIAKTIFFIAVVLFLVSAVVGLARGTRLTGTGARPAIGQRRRLAELRLAVAPRSRRPGLSNRPLTEPRPVAGGI